MAAHRVVLGHVPQRDVHVSHYPYVSTKSTIRIRDGATKIRVSDHLRQAPDEVMRGLMVVLVARLHRKPEPACAAADIAAYRDHLHSEPLTQTRRASKRSRGRKVMEAEGAHRSLRESYLRVCLDMNLPRHRPPNLGWSPTASRRRFGHHDPSHDAIVISRVLDDANVPEWVLDFVVYHEILHIVYPPEAGSGQSGRRRVHTRAFRQAERRYPRWQEAEAWLQGLAKGRLPSQPHASRSLEKAATR